MTGMKRVLPLLLLVASSTFAQDRPIESGWRNIKVFETRRADVEKLLGKPNPDIDKIYTVYSTPDGTVTIVYSDTPCSVAPGEKGDFKVEKDTVIDYRVSFEKPFPLLELKWKKEKYKRSEDPHRSEVFVYDDPLQGISITTGFVDGTEMVGSFWFRGSGEQERQYRCKT